MVLSFSVRNQIDHLARLGVRGKLDRAFRAVADASRVAGAQITQQRNLADRMELDASFRAVIDAAVAQQAKIFVQTQAKSLWISLNGFLWAGQDALGRVALGAGHDPLGELAVFFVDTQASQSRRHLAKMGPGTPLLADPAAGTFL
jgi:hypothetical protein